MKRIVLQKAETVEKRARDLFHKHSGATLVRRCKTRVEREGKVKDEGNGHPAL